MHQRESCTVFKVDTVPPANPGRVLTNAALKLKESEYNEKKRKENCNELRKANYVLNDICESLKELVKKKKTSCLILPL